MMSSSISILSGLTLDPAGPDILGSLILKLSFVLGGDTGLFCDGVCHELTTEEDEGDTARG